MTELAVRGSALQDAGASFVGAWGGGLNTPGILWGHF